jgi:hypothetical protein
LISEFMQIHSNSLSALDSFYKFRINAVLVEMNNKYPRCFLCGKLGFHPSRDNKQEFRVKPGLLNLLRALAIVGKEEIAKTLFASFSLMMELFVEESNSVAFVGAIMQLFTVVRRPIFSEFRLVSTFYNLPETAQVFNLDDLTKYVYDCASVRRCGYDQEYFISRILTRCLEFTSFKTFPINYKDSLPPKEVLQFVYEYRQIRCFRCGYIRPPTHTRQGPLNCSEATTTCNHPVTSNLAETPLKVGGQLLEIECEVCGRDCSRGKCRQRTDILGFEIETYKPKFQVNLFSQAPEADSLKDRL